MREAIHALKYGGLQPAASRLGEMLADAISGLVAETPAEMLVIPVPLHQSKFAQRGFNQARLLATSALASLRRTSPNWRLTLVPGTVVRIRATDSQASLTPRQRRINVRGAFVVADPQMIAQKAVLVIDDIFTTGATARSVAQALMRSGAASVWVATLARARRAFDYRGRFDSDSSDWKLQGEEPESGAAQDWTQDLPLHEREQAKTHSLPNQPSF